MGTTETIGVLVPFFTKHYYLEILRGLEQSASSNDYSIIVYNVERAEQVTAHLEYLARNRRVDGLVIIAIEAQLVDDIYRDHSPFPVAAVDTNVRCAFRVSPDHKSGMYQAISHLVGLGHTRIALVDRQQEPVSRDPVEQRLSGFRRALQEASLEEDRAYMMVTDYSEAAGFEAVSRLLNLPVRPTAIACASDMQAVGAIRAVQDAGFRVGIDVALTGYHDVEVARYVDLTTVHVPAYEMGAAAIGILTRTLAGAAPEGEIVFPTSLVVRGSSGDLRH